MIVKKFKDPRLFIEMQNLAIDWLATNLMKESSCDSASNPNSLYYLSARPKKDPELWDEIASDFQKITGNRNKVDRIIRFKSPSWVIFATSKLSRPYDIVENDNSYNLYIHLDDELLLLQCKLALS